MPGPLPRGFPLRKTYPIALTCPPAGAWRQHDEGHAERPASITGQCRANQPGRNGGLGAASSLSSSLKRSDDLVHRACLAPVTTSAHRAGQTAAAPARPPPRLASGIARSRRPFSCPQVDL